MAGYSNQLKNIRNLMVTERNWWKELNKAFGWVCLTPEGLSAWHDQLGTEAVLGFVSSDPFILDDRKLSATIPYIGWSVTILAKATIQEVK